MVPVCGKLTREIKTRVDQWHCLWFVFVLSWLWMAAVIHWIWNQTEIGTCLMEPMNHARVNTLTAKHLCLNFGMDVRWSSPFRRSGRSEFRTRLGGWLARSIIFKEVITKLGVDSLEFKFQALPVMRINQLSLGLLYHLQNMIRCVSFTHISLCLSDMHLKD